MYFFAGGGGGAGAAGTSANSSTTGAGGNGVAYNISGATVYYGGGGGGGVQNNGSYAYSAASGGLGGGGTGGVGGGSGSNTAAVAGTNGLGGGGGGAGNSGNGAAGGSGVVVVSYAYVSSGQVTLSGPISVPVTSTILDTVLPNGSAPDIVVNSAMSGAGGINIASSAGAGGIVSYAVAQGYTGGTTVNANATLQLGANNALPYGAGTGNVSVNGTLDLNGQTTTNVNGLSGTGAVTSTAAGTPLLVVGNNAASSTFGGVLQNGSGTLSLTKTGAGTQILSGANTYTGGTTINGGTLGYTNLNALGSGTVTLSGGTLQKGVGGTNTFPISVTTGTASTLDLGSYGGDFNGAMSGGGTLTMIGNNIFGMNANNSGFSGTLNVNNVTGGQNWINNINALSANAAYNLGSGNGGLIMSGGAGTYYLGALGGASGNVSSNSSGSVTLQIGNLNTNTTFSGTINNGNATVSLSKVGTGMLTLTGANGYNGGTSVTSGTLDVVLPSNSAWTQSSSGVSVSGGASYKLDFSNQTNLGSPTIKAQITGSSPFTAAGGAYALMPTTSTLAAGQTAYLTGTNYGLWMQGDGNLVLYAGPGQTNVRWASSHQFSGNYVTMQSDGNLVLYHGAGVYSGWSSGTGGSNLVLALGANGGLAVVTAPSYDNIGNNADTGTMELYSTNALTPFIGGVVITAGGITGSGVINKTGSGSVDFSIFDSVGNSLSNSGSNGLNAFNGTLNITAGTLSSDQQTSSTPVGSGQMQVNISGSAALDILGGGLKIDTLSGTGAVQSSTGLNNPTLTVGANNGNSTFSGVISGALALTKTGAGTQVLSGANIYTGATSINGGTLNLSHQYAAQNSTVAMGGGNLVFDSSVVGNAFTLGGLSAASNGAGYDISLQNNAGSPVGIALTVGNNGANTTYSGVLSGGGSLTKIGGGALTLNGANTYTGGTTLNYGTLVLSSTGGPAIPGNLVVAANPVQTYVTLTQPNQFASTSTVTVNSTNGNWCRLALMGNNQTLAGITDAGGAVIQNGQINQSAPTSATLTLNLSTTNNNISGFMRDYDNQNANSATLGLTVNGSGMLTLSGGNISYSGATSVTGGTLVVGQANWTSSNVTMANSANLAVSYTAGAGSFTKQLSGTAGTVSFNVYGNTSDSGGGDGGNYALQDTGGFTGTVVINAGLVAPNADAAFGASGNTILLNAANGNSAGLVATGGLTLPNTRNIQLTTSDGNGIFRAYGSQTFEIDGVVSGPGNFYKTDGGTVVLTGSDTYTGSTRIGQGILQLGNGAAGMDGSIGNTSGVTDNGTLYYKLYGSQTASYPITGTGNLYKTSGGTLILSASNSYSGGTELLGGTLQVNAMSGIGTGYLGIKGGGTFRYTGTGSETDTRTMWNDTGNGGGGGTIEIVNSSATLTLNPASGAINQNLTKAGPGTLVLGGIGISGGAAVTVNGGALTLTSGNSYNGATTVNAGTLSVINGGSVSSSAVTVNANGTLNLSQPNQGFGSRTNIAGNNITGSGVIDVNNTGSGISGGWVYVTSPNAMNFSGTININSGVFSTDGQQGAGVIQGTATVNVASGGVFSNHSSNGVTIGALNGAGDVTPAQAGGGTYNLTVGNGDGSGTFSGIIHGNNSTASSDGSMEAGYLSLTKTGAGIEVLTGANTYTGATTVSGGTLAITGAGVLGSGHYPASITNNAALVFNSSTNQTLAGAISGAGSLTQSGNNVLTLSGNNSSYSGPITVNGGTLELATAASAPAGSTVAVGPSAGLQLDAAGATLSSLSVADASTLVLPSTGTTGTALTNALTFVSTPSVTVKPVLGSVPSLGSTYNLITGSAAVSGTPGTITTDLSAYAPTRVTGTTSISGNNLVFTVATGPANLVWNNAAGNSTWDLGTSTNFNNNGTNDVFQTFDSVTFDDTATPGAVTLSGNLQAGVVTVNNSTGNYTFAGPGAITGPGSLVKSGSSALILTGNNSYTGGTTISGGVLQIGDGSTTNGAIGSGTYSVASGARLYLNYATASGANFGNIIGGGTLELNSAGSGNWDGSILTSSFSGTVQIDRGRLYAPSAGAGLGGATTVVVQNGAQFGDWNGGTYPQNFILAGTGWGEGGYAVAIRGGDSSTTINGNVTLTAATGLGAGGSMQLNGTLYGGGFPLTVGDSDQRGALTLNGTTTSSLGGITLNYGTLVIGSSGNVTCGGITGPGGVRAGLNVAAGGTLTATSFGTSYNVTQFNISGTASLGSVFFSVGASPTMTGAGLLNVTSLTVHNWTNLSDAMTGGTMTVGSGGIVNTGQGNNYFNAGATTIGATAPWSSSMGIGLTDATTGTTFDTTGGNITLSGGLNGSGILHKAGPGTLYLSGANSYTGATSVNNGTLQIGTGGSTGSLSTSSSITDNGVLAFNRNNTAVQGTDFSSSPIAGSGALVQMGPGMLVLNAANGYGGGTLQLGNSSALPSNGALAVNNGTFDLAGYGVTVPSFSGAGGGGVVTNSGGTLATLSVNQTGNTTFNGGATTAWS